MCFDHGLFSYYSDPILPYRMSIFIERNRMQSQIATLTLTRVIQAPVAITKQGGVCAQKIIMEIRIIDARESQKPVNSTLICVIQWPNAKTIRASVN